MQGAPNGLRYWRWGGRGLCLRAEKTRSQKNACDDDLRETLEDVVSQNALLGSFNHDLVLHQSNQSQGSLSHMLFVRTLRHCDRS